MSDHSGAVEHLRYAAEMARRTAEMAADQRDEYVRRAETCTAEMDKSLAVAVHYEEAADALEAGDA